MSWLSAVTGRFFSADGTGVFNTPASQQPLFTRVFPGVFFNAPLGGVTELMRPFTSVVLDGAGAFAGTIPAEGNGYQAGVGALYGFSGVFTGTFTVPSAGQVTLAVTSSDGFVLGIGGGATRVSGPQVNVPAVSTFQGYAVMGGTNARTAPLVSTMIVNFPSAGTYPYEIDFAKGGYAALTLRMTAGGLPIPVTTLLTLSPSTVPSALAGTAQGLTVTARDGNGLALAGLPVTMTVTGLNGQSAPVVTDGTGQAVFAYAGSRQLTGADLVQASSGAGVSNVVRVGWHNGTNQAPLISAGPAVSVTMPLKAVLAGTGSDDGLPAGSALTLAWSKVSGPGSVVFDNPAQAATAAGLLCRGVMCCG